MLLNCFMMILIFLSSFNPHHIYYAISLFPRIIEIIFESFYSVEWKHDENRNHEFK